MLGVEATRTLVVYMTVSRCLYHIWLSSTDQRTRNNGPVLLTKTRGTSVSLGSFGNKGTTRLMVDTILNIKGILV